MNYPKTSQMTALLGTASLMALSHAQSAFAQQMVAQAEEIPETVLITGSLIRGTAAVGVPVVNLSPQDFAMTGTLTASDLFRTIPQFNVNPGPVATAAANVERGIRVNLRQLDTGSAPRSLMMVDGMRYPPQGNGLCQLDPSIIPAIAIERIDLLLDGASATYGSDAIGGVINIILKRNFDGAQVEGLVKMGKYGNTQYEAGVIWGRTWDGGQVTLSYQWSNTSPTLNASISKMTYDHTPWGFDDRRPLGSSFPSTLSTGAPQGPSMPNPAFIDPLTTPNVPPTIPNPAYPGNSGQNCTNCWALPLGVGQNWDPGASGLGPPGKPIGMPNSNPYGLSLVDWSSFNNAANSGTNGTRNVFEPYSISWYSAATENTGGAMTIDQRLTSNVSFYGEAFWSMRRARFNNVATGNLLLVGVPTFNPYYPVNGAPNNLRVAYNMNLESPSITKAYAIGSRYQLGLNFALPGSWGMQVYYAVTRDAEFNHTDGGVNKAAVSAALGWTLPATAPAGTTPTIATWTKPANVPYLNLFCDARAFTCNSPTTLAYIDGFGETKSQFIVNEKGIKADGPLFDLPGGSVKMAVGGTYTTYHFHILETEQGTSNPTVGILSDAPNRAVWAVFTQVNVPVFSDQNGFFGMRRFDLEFSWRHDQYSDVGGTSNPKVGFNWAPIEDFTIRGGWGNSFRAPNFGENSPISNVAWQGWGLPDAVYFNSAQIRVRCDPATGAPPANSGGEKLFNAGFGCNTQPPGLSLNGGGKAAALTGMRDYYNQESFTLRPELSTNWAIGFDYTPAGNFLTGLNLQATYYIVKVNGILQNFGNPNDSRFNDPSVGFAFIVPSDVGCPAEQNATPWLCDNFQDIVTRVLSYQGNPVPPEARTLIYWVNDGGTQNKGWQRTEGVDWSASYDWEWGDLGAFNVGNVGTYYLSQENQRVAGDIINDFYNTDLNTLNGVEQLGVESRPRLKMRSRIGWSNGTWSISAFHDFQQHFFHSQAAPPNVNFACITPGGTVGGLPTYTNPCWITDYTNIMPSYHTFDLSIGYDTGDRPANEYLRNIAVNLVVQNITDRHASYQYRISTGGGNPCACDLLYSLYGRIISLRLQKTF
jgi:outer membrane receptor protein involved in Fe transport